jgi:hypothetical protein
MGCHRRSVAVGWSEIRLRSVKGEECECSLFGVVTILCELCTKQYLTVTPTKDCLHECCTIAAIVAVV